MTMADFDSVAVLRVVRDDAADLIQLPEAHMQQHSKLVPQLNPFFKASKHARSQVKLPLTLTFRHVDNVGVVCCLGKSYKVRRRSFCIESVLETDMCIQSVCVWVCVGVSHLAVLYI